MMPSTPSVPRWFLAVVIMALLPLLWFPYLLDICPAESHSRTILWIYPFYAVMSGYLSWQCYPQRRVVAWILIVLLILSHMAAWLLVTSPVQ